MAEFRQFTYSNTGTESDFLQGLIDFICSIDDDITCVDSDGNPTTAAEQFADLTSASKAKVLFNFGNGVTGFHLERGGTNNQNIQYYFVGNYGHALNFYTGAIGAQVEATRSFTIIYYKSETIKFLGLGDYNATGMSGIKHFFTLLINNNDKYVGYTDAPNTSLLNNVNFVGENMTLTVPSVLNYSAGAGKIDLFEGYPFISGGARQFLANGVVACSTVTLFSTIALPNGKIYFAIHTNAMVDITPPESENEGTTDAQNAAVESVS